MPQAAAAQHLKQEPPAFVQSKVTKLEKVPAPPRPATLPTQTETGTTSSQQHTIIIKYVAVVDMTDFDPQDLRHLFRTELVGELPSRLMVRLKFNTVRNRTMSFAKRLGHVVKYSEDDNIIELRPRPQNRCGPPATRAAAHHAHRRQSQHANRKHQRAKNVRLRPRSPSQPQSATPPPKMTPTGAPPERLRACDAEARREASAHTALAPAAFEDGPAAPATEKCSFLPHGSATPPLGLSECSGRARSTPQFSRVCLPAAEVSRGSAPRHEEHRQEGPARLRAVCSHASPSPDAAVLARAAPPCGAGASSQVVEVVGGRASFLRLLLRRPRFHQHR